MRKHLAFLGAHAIHQLRDPVGSKQAHEIVFERQEELRRARISLTAGTAAQLPVDAPRLVALRSDDVQAAQLHDVDELVFGVLALRGLRFGDAGSELDVGSAAGHVGRDRHRPRLSRSGHDLGLALVILGVEYVVRNPGPLEHARQSLRHFHAHRSDEYRKAELVQTLRLLENRVVFLAARLEHQILAVVADDVAIGRYHRDAELVDLVELRLFRLGGARHSRQLLVEAEIVLDGDGGEGLGLALHLHAFLRFNRLV